MRLRSNSEAKPVGLDKRLQSYLNQDLLSTPYEDRTWSAWDYLAFYVSLNGDLSIMLSFFRMLDQGLNWWHIMLIVLIANSLLAVIMVFNGKSGAKYGIPFVMVARSCFGIRGSAVVGVLRALLSIQLYSLTLYTICYLLSVTFSVWSEGFRQIPNQFPSDSNMDPQRAITFAMAWILNLLLALFGKRVIKRAMIVKAVAFSSFIVGMCIWAAVKTSGPGPILQSSQQFRFEDYGQFFGTFFPAIGTSIGVWFLMAINIADYTRFARNNSAQMIGQLAGLPLFSTIFTIAGMALVSMYLASTADPGEFLRLTQLAMVDKSQNSQLVAIIALFLSFALLVSNLLINLVPCAYALSNIWPSRLGFRSGALLAALLSVACVPWIVFPQIGQISPYINVISVAISSVVGVLISDYYFISHQWIDVDNLTFRDGQYWFTAGFNPFAFLALLGGIVVNVPWALAYLRIYQIGWMVVVFQFSWLIGPLVSGLLYWLLMRFTVGVRDRYGLSYSGSSNVGTGEGDFVELKQKQQSPFLINNDMALVDALAGNDNENNNAATAADSTSTASTKIFND